MNKLLLLLTLAPCLAFGQTTLIPNANFENALINLGVDNVLDGSVLTSNIDTITYLWVPSANISDLTGIEDFAALTYLKCSANGLTSLDVSNNTALTELWCGSNDLPSLDVSNNTALTELYCWNNQLTSLDVSKNTALTDLYCTYNQLTRLDISNNTALTVLEVYVNQLTCLNVNNGSLQWLDARINPDLTCIEVSDVVFAGNNWGAGLPSNASFNAICPDDCSGFASLGLEKFPQPKALLYITDILGRTTLPVPNTLLFYIYEDGSVEKRIQLER